MTPQPHSKSILITLAIATLMTITGCSARNTTAESIQIHTSNLGNIYTDSTGMTLYTFNKDKTNISNLMVAVQQNGHHY